MKKVTFFILITYALVIVLLFISCKNEQTNDHAIALFAAAGTMIPINEISQDFSDLYSINIEKNYAASGTLARQIVNGAKADVFISANKEWINYLQKNNLLIDSTVYKLAKNKLVVICHKSRNLEIEFKRDFNIHLIVTEQIVIGDPSYVPAGNYAKQVLNALGWYNAIKDKIIQTNDVSSALHLVELNECDWGIVYYSEAIKSNKIKIIAEIPDNLHDSIYFYMALLKDSKEESKLLYEYLKSGNSQKVFEDKGFITIIN